jgi:hypothetical protein
MVVSQFEFLRNHPIIKPTTKNKIAGPKTAPDKKAITPGEIELNRQYWGLSETLKTVPKISPAIAPFLPHLKPFFI